jgi:hypothetical protein
MCSSQNEIYFLLFYSLDYLPTSIDDFIALFSNAFIALAEFKDVIRFVQVCEFYFYSSLFIIYYLFFTQVDALFSHSPSISAQLA